MRSRAEWRRACALAIGACALLCSGPATAFLPTSSPSPDLVAISHQRITREALEAVDAEIFGGTPTQSMRLAMREIATASAELDRDEGRSAWHFDGENFAGGQALLATFQPAQIRATLQSAGAGAARRHLGQALHTLQDFYAHSTWIELGGDVHPDLGVPGATLGMVAAPADPTCSDCTPVLPPGCPDCSANVTSLALTSGFLSASERPKPFATKCSHGGPADTSVTGAALGINKDTEDCELSPHASLHAQAVAAAREATKKFLRELAAELTPRERRLLFGGGPTVALAVNVVGSCPAGTGCTNPPYLQLKAPALSLFQGRLGSDEEPAKYVLVPFTGPVVAPTLATTDPQAFFSSLAGLTYHPTGGSCPQPSIGAMLQALSAADEGGTLFLIDRHSANDRELGASVAALAVAKRIQIFPVLFGNSCNEPVDPAHVRAAEESGGQIFGTFPPIAISDMGAIVRLMDLLVRRDLVRLLSVSGRLTESPTFVPVPIDSTVRRVTFSFSGMRTVPLWRPDGTRVFVGQPGVSYVMHRDGEFCTVTDPQPGVWRVDLAGFSPFALRVFAESALDFDLRFVEAAGRPGHEGVYPIAGLPAAGRANDALADLWGPFDAVAFELRALDGSFLQALPLAPRPGEGPGGFSGSFALPGQPFLVYAVGTDAAGYPFQRLVPTPMQPQPVRIVPPAPSTHLAGTSPTFVFEVENLSSAPASYRFSAADERGFVSTVTPGELNLDPGQSLPVSVQLSIPAGAAQGSTVMVTATVEGIGGTVGRNFAVVTDSVGPLVDVTPPVIAAFTASPRELWPPNRQLREVSLSLDVTDDGAATPTCAISGVTSDESIGDAPDWVIGPGPLELRLRAERDALGDGRVYTIEVACTDAAENTSTASAHVSVPSRGKPLPRVRLTAEPRSTVTLQPR